MATDLYTLTAPVFIRALTNLDKILDKGRAFAADQGIDESELLEARLIGDMGNLVSQIQRASDSAKGVMVRVGGVENVVMQDNETSFHDIKARIARTIDFLRSVPADTINGKERRRRRGKIPQPRIHLRRACRTCSASQRRTSISTSPPPTISSA